jgi:transglutaminase-like putative cysteine protease
MQKIICSVLTVFIFTFALSAEEFLTIEDITAAAAHVTVERFPDSNDVLIDDFMFVEYQPDGTSVSMDDTVVKILTEKGKRKSRTISSGFDTAYGTNYFTRVQIIKPDGSMVEIDPVANSKVMVDPGQMSANIYNPNSKVLRLSIPGLETGDILRYCITRERTKAVVPDTWSDYKVFEHTSPILNTTYKVVAPKSRPLVNIALKAEIPGTVTFSEEKSEESDRIVYTWKVKDVPRMFDEPNMPTRYTVVQRLLVSTMEEWEDLSKWYWDLCAPRLDATTPELETKARELIDGKTNTLEKIEAVFNFVSQDIRYMGITTEDEAPGYEPHDVSLTFSNRYGVCRDKAALLASMLRVVDVEAFPVIIMAGPKKDEEVPQPLFNHAVTAALGVDGEYVLMDSTDENTKDIFPSYLQNMSYIVARPEGDTLRTSPIIPAEDNLIRITNTATLDSDGNLEGESAIVFEGINDTVYRGYLSKIKPDERRRFFEGHIKRSMPTAELDDWEILPEELRDTSQPMTVNISYSAKNLLIEGKDKKMLSLPKLGGSVGYANFLIGQTGLEERKYPLYTRITAGIRETLDLEIPDDLGTVTIPGYSPIETDQLTWNIGVAQNGNRLMATNNFLMNTVEFSPEEYLVLKKNLKEIEYNSRKKLIIDPDTEGAGVNSDVRILDRDIRIVLESESKWTETSRTRLEVLTYGGKKKNSEIKLGYNPSWQTVELKSATVTQPDGTVKTIGEDELNLMDASWVASAPRYPAERLLVATLPGVEIGSIIEYEYVSTVDGKPFFSTTQAFNSHEPIDSKTLTVTAPDTVNLKIRNTGIAESRSASDGTVTYVWSADNQAPVKVEEALPSWWAFNPVVFLSASNWKTYAELVHDHLLAATKDQPESKALAKQIVDGLKTETEKAEAIRNWTAKNLRGAGPGLTALPLSAITPADTTLEERYGNNPDRMVLIYTLLKAAGFDPEFILSGPISFIPEIAEPLLSIPSRGVFGTVLIEVDVDGKTVYMAGESQYSKLGASGYDRRTKLNLHDGSIGKIRVSTELDDRSRARYEMSVGENGSVGFTQTVKKQGTAYEGFHSHYAEITPENRRRHYLEMVSGFSQSARAASELITDYNTYPGKLEYSIVADRYAVNDGDYLYFTVPANLGGVFSYRSTERTLPLVWSGYSDGITELDIVLPDDYEPVILPKSFSWSAPNGAGLVEMAVEYSPLANAVRIVQLVDTDPALIDAEDFPSIIEADRKLSHPDMRTILLKKKD